MDAGMDTVFLLSHQLLDQLNAYEAVLEQIDILTSYMDTCIGSTTCSSQETNPPLLPHRRLRLSLGLGVRRMYDQYRLRLGRRAKKTHVGLLQVLERCGIELHVLPMLDHPMVQRPLTNREDNSVQQWMEEESSTYREG